MSAIGPDVAALQVLINDLLVSDNIEDLERELLREMLVELSSGDLLDGQEMLAVADLRDMIWRDGHTRTESE